MRSQFGLKSIVLALLLAMAAAVPAFSQERSASKSMREAGESAENAASNATDAVRHAYQGTATAVKDSTTTAEVKTAILVDKITAGSVGDIHVATVAGVVILNGEVASSEVAQRAQQLAQQTVGVKGTKNELTVMSGASAAH